MKPVLIACECSQVECSAFRRLGIEAYSCDIQDCYGGHQEWHIKADAVKTLYEGDWGLVIAHPPCTYLAAVGSPNMYKDGRIDTGRYEKMCAGKEFFMQFYNYRCAPICVENPRPMAMAQLPPKNQIICPSEFGHPWTKRTFLWLHELPQLLPTHAKDISAKSWVYHTHHGNKRCRSFTGIAQAMAEQWSKYII